VTEKDKEIKNHVMTVHITCGCARTIGRIDWWDKVFVSGIGSVMMWKCDCGRQFILSAVK
jgi:hypothetical protein